MSAPYDNGGELVAEWPVYRSMSREIAAELRWYDRGGSHTVVVTCLKFANGKTYDMRVPTVALDALIEALVAAREAVRARGDRFLQGGR